MELARRLELAEARDAVQFAEVWARSHPEAGPASLEIAGGQAAFGGAGSPLSHAVGLGMNGPVSAGDFVRFEQFYRERGAAPTLDICPLADPSLIEHTGRRGYRIVEFNNVLVGRPDPGSVCKNEAIRPASDETEWTQTVCAGFFERSAFTREELELSSALFHMPAAVPWIGYSGGEPAAAANMAIQSGLALLFGDSTVPKFRRQGWHRALIEARMSHAAAHGCDLATASTLPGSASQRHYERLGFRVVYTKLIMSCD